MNRFLKYFGSRTAIGGAVALSLGLAVAHFGLVAAAPATALGSPPASLNAIMNQVCPGAQTCLQSTFVDPGNLDSVTVAGDTFAHVYGYRQTLNVNQTVQSKILGDLYTSSTGFDCKGGSYCMHYMVKSGNTILQKADIKLEVSSAADTSGACAGLPDCVTYTAKANASAYFKQGTIRVTILNPAYYNVHLLIIRSRCSKIGTGYCSIPSSSTSDIVVQPWIVQPVVQIHDNRNNKSWVPDYKTQSLTPTTPNKLISVYPGDIVSWRIGYMVTQGVLTTAIRGTIKYWYGDGTDLSQMTQADGSVKKDLIADNNNSPFNVTTTSTWQNTPNYTIPNSAKPGDFVCMRAATNPSAGNAGTVYSRPVCATVVFNYNLTPKTRLTASGADGATGTLVQGQLASFYNLVNNSGPSISQNNAHWRAFTFVVPAGKPVPTMNAKTSTISVNDGDGNLNLNNIYGVSSVFTNYIWRGSSDNTTGGQTNCNMAYFGASPWNLTFPVGDKTICNLNNISTSTLGVGDLLCMGVWLENYSNSAAAGTYSYSKPACYKIADKGWQLTPQICIQTNVDANFSDVNAGKWSGDDTTACQGGVSSNSITVAPGQSVYWRHRFTTNVSSPLSSPVTVKWGWQGTTSGTSITPVALQDVTVPPPGNFISGWSNVAPFSKPDKIEPIPLDTPSGTVYCRQTFAQPSDYATNSGTVTSDPACAKVIANFTNKPVTDTSSGGAVENIDFGTNVTFNNYVIDDLSAGSSTMGLVKSWTGFTFIVPAGNALPSDDVKDVSNSTLLLDGNAMVNEVYYGGDDVVNNYTWRADNNSQTNCADSSVGLGGSLATSPGGTPDQKPYNTLCNTNKISTSDLDPGDSICMAVVIQPYTSNDVGLNNNRFSRPACYTMTKSPQIQIRGADSKSGATQFGQMTALTDVKYKGGFTGSGSSNPLRGSWSQFGLISNGPIAAFGSNGATLSGSGTTGSVSANRRIACQLLFANASTGGKDCTGATVESYGNLGVQPRTITLPAVAEYTDQRLKDSGYSQISSSRNLDGLTSGTYYVTGDITIEASTLTRDQNLTLVTAADSTSPVTITIAGDIVADSEITYAADELTKLPNLTIIADKIMVQGDVTDLYGTYIARDRFFSCDQNRPGTNDLGATGYCSQQLTVTGAIISKNMPHFWRTAGAGKDAEASIPAEIIQYTPNLYLTPYAASQTGSLDHWTNSSAIQELPARL